MGELVGESDPDIRGECGPTDEDGLLGVHVQTDDVGLAQFVLRGGNVDIAVHEPESPELTEGTTLGSPVGFGSRIRNAHLLVELSVAEKFDFDRRLEGQAAMLLVEMHDTQNAWIPFRALAR